MTDPAVGRQLFMSNRPIDFTKIPLTLISPIFGHLSDVIFGDDNELSALDFAPARDLANTLSMLLPEIKRVNIFNQWLHKTLRIPDSSSATGDESRVERNIILKETGNTITYESDGHVVVKDRLAIVTEGKPEITEGSSEPHWQAMGYYRMFYVQDEHADAVGQNCLPALMISYYGMDLSIHLVNTHTDALQDHALIFRDSSCIAMER